MEVKMDSLKNAHFEACKADGMTDDEIAQDWEVFLADYEAMRDEEDALETLDCRGTVPCGGCQACLDAQMDLRRLAG
jgi:hypothetical protein